MNPIVETALKWEGQEFKPDIPAQCAEWVSTILDSVKITGQGYHHTAWCPDLAEMGALVKSMSDLQPGDLVLFDNTYETGEFTHVGIYLGNGDMIHRNTMSSPVQRAYIKADYWMDKFNQGRRFKIEEGKEKEFVKIFVHDGKATIIQKGVERSVSSLTLIVELKPD